MDYNNEENNRYPQNQNGYQNNVPKPTFSGVMGRISQVMFSSRTVICTITNPNLVFQIIRRQMGINTIQ